MAGQYDKFLRPSLRQVVEEQTSLHAAQQLELYEELALMRDAVGPALQLYQAAREASMSQPESMDLRQAWIEAGIILGRHVDQISRLAKVAGEQERARSEKLDAAVIFDLVNDFARAARQIFGRDPRVRELQQHLARSVQLSGTPGTDRAPYDTVEQMILLMDASVPVSQQIVEEAKLTPAQQEAERLRAELNGAMQDVADVDAANEILQRARATA